VAFQVVGSAVRADSVPIDTVTREKPVIVVLGNEGSGIRTNILNRCDVVVELGPFSSLTGAENRNTEDNSPHTSSSVTHEAENNADSSSSASTEDGGVDSLNVSVAGGIILHYFLGSSR
jgi:tRNA G18 (ribose-2'-O)-methylase SpoU